MTFHGQHAFALGTVIVIALTESRPDSGDGGCVVAPDAQFQNTASQGL
jgi:hypothetical protein